MVTIGHVKALEVSEGLRMSGAIKVSEMDDAYRQDHDGTVSIKVGF